MKENQLDCLCLKAATALAHKKGLLPKNEVLSCEYYDECDPVNCRKALDPNSKTVYLKQNCSETDSQITKFFSKLEKWQVLSGKT